MVEEIVEHRRYSPSQADRFFACPGSVRRIQNSPPRHSTQDADEGTKAHKLLEINLRHGKREFSIGHGDDYQGWQNPDTMYAVNAALDYIWPLYDELNALYGDAVLFIEEYVEPPCDAAPGETGGLVDVAIYSAIGRQLYVIDYKHGVGIYKAAEGNRQVTQYGAGFLFGKDKKVDPSTVDDVTLVIIQPRSYHEDGEVREYDTTPAKLLDYLLELEEAVEACEKEDAPLVPGMEQCHFCPANTTCPAREKAALQVIDPSIHKMSEVTKSKLPDPKNLDPERMGYALMMLPMLKSWVNDMEKHGFEMALDGHAPAGYKLVETKAKRHWYGEPDKLAPRLAALIGCPPDDLFEKKFITITDAEKRVKAAFKKRVSKKKRKQAAEDGAKAFAYFTTKQSSGNLTLAEVDDPRPAVNVSEQTFGDVGRLITAPTKEK